MQFFYSLLCYLKFILPHHGGLIKIRLLKESQPFCTNNEQLKQPDISLGLNDVANLKTRAISIQNYGYYHAYNYIHFSNSFRIHDQNTPYCCLDTTAINVHKLRACSYGKKFSRLARKHFDKFSSEISPSYENSMKSYLAFI